MNVDFISLLDKLSVLESTVPAVEASPNTLKGSFSKDLIKSKKWLTNLLAKILKNKNPGTIYVLGSWYGNIGLYLDQAGVKFDRLVLIDPDSEALTKSKELLSKLDNENRLVLVNKKAEDCNYKKPGIIINTSCNETGPLFLRNIEDNMLCILQSRNNVNDVLTTTDNLDELVELFPLKKTYYTGEKSLNDIETEYNRYMVIGRAGKNLNEGDEEHHTGGSLGLPFPGTYEQEYTKFKRKGPRRITAMTNEAFDSSYEYRASKQNPGSVFYFDTEDGQEYKVEFQPDGKSAMVAFYARGHGDQHKIGLTGTGNASKIFGTVINVIKDYVAQNSPLSLYFTASNSEPSRVKLYKVLAQKVGQALPGFSFANMLNRKDTTMFIVKHENAPKTSMALAKTKNAAGKALDAVFDEEIAYHGTSDNITEFRPLTHFGTEKAAKDRMIFKKIKDGKIYKVDLDIKNPLTIKDFPGIHYDRLYAFELKNKKLISQEEMEDITFTQDPVELRSKLLAKLNELGIDGFVYKNRYEDKGNISYVITNPNQVKVLSVEPATETVTEDHRKLNTSDIGE